MHTVKEIHKSWNFRTFFTKTERIIWSHFTRTLVLLERETYREWEWAEMADEHEVYKFHYSQRAWTSNEASSKLSPQTSQPPRAPCHHHHLLHKPRATETERRKSQAGQTHVGNSPEKRTQKGIQPPGHGADMKAVRAPWKWKGKEEAAPLLVAELGFEECGCPCCWGAGGRVIC